MHRSLLRKLFFGCLFVLLSPEIIESVLAQRNYDVRLVGGLNSAEGRVEIYYSSRWGTVCDDTWGLEESKVVCRQLGFDVTTAAPETHGRDTFGEGPTTGKIWLDDVRCIGLEAKLSDCSHREWGFNDCSHSEDVGVRCPEGRSEGDIRLVGGTTLNQGRLEIYHDEKWGTVCDDNWDTSNNNGAVACRQLGYSGVDRVNAAFYDSEGFGPIWLDEVSCSGTELTLSSCTRNVFGIHDCTHSEDIGLRCLPKVLSGSLRLVDGATVSEGRIEIFYREEWGTVCDNGWGINEATVACNQLGFPGAQRADISFGPGTGVIWLDSVNCLGTEDTLAECDHNDWGLGNQCTHSNDAAVRCSSGDSLEGEVRLLGGTIAAEGRVEIFHDGEWGTVCDDSWDWSDAEVVCRQLEYAGVDLVYDSAHFGEGFGKIWLDDLECTGAELRLSDCFHPGWEIENCGHSEDAGVRCSYEGASGAVRLVNGPSDSEGLLEIYFDYQWGTVCDDSFDSIDSEVVCKQLGFKGSVDYFSAADKGYGVLDSSIPIWLESVICDGSEVQLSYCSHNGWGVHDCSHSEDIAIQCSVKGQSLSAGAISGIVIGCLVGLFLFYYCCCRESKSKTPAQVYNSVPIDPSSVQGPLESGTLSRADDGQEPNPTPPTAPDDSLPDLPPPSYDDIGSYTTYGQPGAEVAYPPPVSAPYPPPVSAPYPLESSNYPSESSPYPPAVSPPPSFEAASVAYPYPPSGDEGVVPSAPPINPPS